MSETPLAQWLKLSGVSTADLGRRVGRSKSFISRVATGQRQPSLEVAAKLSQETGLPAQKFLMREQG